MTRERTGRPAVAGVPFRACMFFAANAGAELSSGDIAEKFGMPLAHVCSVLRPVVDCGYLAKTVGGGHVQTVYRAGPVLLDVIRGVLHVDDFAQIKHIRPAGTWERKTPGLAPAQWHEVMA